MRINQFLIAIGVGTMLAACSSDEMQTEKAGGIPINFTANIQNLIPSAGTRVNAGTSGLSITEFTEGSEITVGYYSSSSIDPVLKFESGTWNYTGDKLYFPVNGTATVIGFYPKLTSAIGNVMHGQYSSPTNQSELSTYQSADVMAAAATISSPTSEPVNLTFKHLCAKIVVNISGSSIPSSFTVKMKNLITTGMYGISGDVVRINKMYGASEVTLGNYSDSGQTGIIIPQNVEADTELIEVGAGDVKYTFVTSSAINFKAGYEYTFNLNLNKTAINPGDIAITNWEADPDHSNPIEGNLAQ